MNLQRSMKRPVLIESAHYQIRRSHRWTAIRTVCSLPAALLVLASLATEVSAGSADGLFVGQRFGVGDWPRSVAALDLDGDTVPDLVTANSGSDDVSVLLNQTGDGHQFLRVDCDDDGAVDISDAVFTLNWLFLGGPAPGCIAVTNTNGDDAVDLSDPIYILSHLFLGGPELVAPYPACGPETLPSDEETCKTPPNNCPQ